jgi:xanthine dehydrogenase accessory factor
MNIYEEAGKIMAEGGQAALVTVIATDRSTPREVGAKMLVKSDGSVSGTIGGGGVEHLSIKKAMEAIKEGKPCRFQVSLTPDKDPGMLCGGEMEVFIEPLLNPLTVYIFGGGHISKTLAKMVKLGGFRVAVIDDRPEFANEENFPEADTVMAEGVSEAFEKLRIDHTGYIVIITRGHFSDEAVLEHALKTPARYIGMIGSKSKIKTVFGHLREKGLTQEALEAVHAPIGVPINAETPEEIAVAILAEIIKVRRG